LEDYPTGSDSQLPGSVRPSLALQGLRLSMLAHLRSHPGVRTLVMVSSESRRAVRALRAAAAAGSDTDLLIVIASIAMAKTERLERRLIAATGVVPSVKRTERRGDEGDAQMAHNVSGVARPSTFDRLGDGVSRENAIAKLGRDRASSSSS